MIDQFPVPVAEGVTPETPDPVRGPDGCGVSLAVEDQGGAAAEGQIPLFGSEAK